MTGGGNDAWRAENEAASIFYFLFFIGTLLSDSYLAMQRLASNKK